MRKVGLLLCTMLMVSVGVAVADVPHMVNYQGYLTDTDGNSLDTTVAMTFKLYTDSTAGSLLWTETRPSITVTEGLFDVHLGQVTFLGDAVFNNPQVWLGITVGDNTEMAPRSRIVSVGYAYRVGTVDGATGGTVVGDLAVQGQCNFGWNNVNTGLHSFVIGVYDSTLGTSSTVSGGGQNSAHDDYATVGGGHRNSARGVGATIGGGESNAVYGGSYNTVGGGHVNSVIGSYSTVSGGHFNRVSGSHTFIGGGDSNNAGGDYTTVGGGYLNTTNSSYVTIGGGYNNSATGQYATIGGGWENTASASSATVGGGHGNVASDFFATVPGGEYNTASGAYSLAAGYRAKANHEGSFVWADHYDEDFASSASNQFNIRATGGVRIYTNYASTSGVTLGPGASMWYSVSDSRKKRNIRSVDSRNILQKVDQLPIKRWSYKAQDPSIEHIGPMAQDFWRLFHLGEDSLGISTIDPEGIALAAIQELKVRTDEIEALKAEVNELKAMLQNLLASRDQDEVEQATFRGIEK